jgi:hypothetical protein
MPSGLVRQHLRVRLMLQQACKAALSVLWRVSRALAAADQQGALQQQQDQAVEPQHQAYCLWVVVVVVLLLLLAVAGHQTS